MFSPGVNIICFTLGDNSYTFRIGMKVGMKMHASNHYLS
jgi:hypothetical protein